MRVTIVDVAKAAGVSFKTVSRVLNGEASVKAQTREKVLSAAKALDFQLNVSARNLRKQRSNLIALLINNPSRSYVENIQIGAMEACARHGYHLIVKDTGGRAETLDALFKKSAMAGAILLPPMSDDHSVLDYLASNNIAYVRIAPETEDARSSHVKMDDERASYEMVSRLIAMGHRRLGIITGGEGFGVTKNRLAGYEQALVEAGLPLRLDYCASGDFSYESGLRAAEQLLSAKERPSAIFCCNDDMAAAAISVAYKLGLRVPDDISIAGFDDTPLALIMCPQISTVRQPIKDMARKAVELLDSALNSPSTAPQHIQLDHEIILRGSSAEHKA